MAALSRTGSTAKTVSRHKEPVELNRYPMGIESGGIVNAIEFCGMEEWILSQGTNHGMFWESAAGGSFRF